MSGQHSHHTHYSHGHSHSHGHLHDDMIRPSEAGGLASERIEFHSVGIDIGSSTSHLLFSRLELRRRGVSLSSGYSVVKREVLFESPILLTPYKTASVIDVEALKQFIDSSYRLSGLSPGRIDTGAVIITGEAAKKENASNILAIFSEVAGKFVCATAGPLLEGRLAAHGSGAVLLSRRTEYAHRPILNVDMGGGTTKISLIQAGEILDVMVVNVGARLLAWDQESRLLRMEDAGRDVAVACGFNVELGTVIEAEKQRVIASRLISVIFEWLGWKPLSPLARSLSVTENRFVPPTDALLVFSGGVGEYVYGLEEQTFGDMGEFFGEHIRKELAVNGKEHLLVQANEQLRATVIGASQYTVQVSGNTIHLDCPKELPLRNLPVVHVDLGEELLTADEIGARLENQMRVYGLDELGSGGAISLRYPIPVSYANLNVLAQGIVMANQQTGLSKESLIILLEQDVAGALGNILHSELKVPNVVCLDQVQAGDLDFIDIGEVIPDAGAVPVIVKSLVFK